MALHLRRSRDQDTEIDRLAARLDSLGGGRVGVSGVLTDLDRQARRRILAPGLAVRRAWQWDRADRDDPSWFPQGVAHSWRTGAVDDIGPGVLLVSWYSKAGEGSRISVLDLATGHYRHVLLVEAVAEADGGMRPVPVHAGGLTWHDRKLHVAATRRGLLTFDTDDLMVDPSLTLGYRYVLPLRIRHEAGAGTDEDVLRHSFLSLDRSHGQVALLVGEYGRPGDITRLARFVVDDSGELVVGDDGCAVPAELGDGLVQMQGAVIIDGVYYVSISHGRRTWGEMAVGRPGAWRRRRWVLPPGPEDLTFHPPTDLIWSVSEHPRRRWVVGVRRSWFD